MLKVLGYAFLLMKPYNTRGVRTPPSQIVMSSLLSLDQRRTRSNITRSVRVSSWAARKENVLESIGEVKNEKLTLQIEKDDACIEERKCYRVLEEWTTSGRTRRSGWANLRTGRMIEVETQSATGQDISMHMLFCEDRIDDPFCAPPISPSRTSPELWSLNTLLFELNPSNFLKECFVLQKSSKRCTQTPRGKVGRLV